MKPKLFKSDWTREMSNDIDKHYGIDVVAELEKMLSEEISSAIEEDKIIKKKEIRKKKLDSL